MRLLINRVFVILLSVALFGIVAGAMADAQVIRGVPKFLASDLYIIRLNSIFQEWNEGKLKIPGKSDLRPVFEKRIADTVARRRYNYQDEHWADEIRRRFNALPENLRREKNLNESAASLLTLLFLKDLAIFRQQVAVERMDNVLNLPLFLLLSKAQIEANAAKKPTIDASSTASSLFYWWTVIWPFCD